MSASLKKEIKEAAKQELEAAYTLIHALSQSLTKLEERVKTLENGNRQRRTPSRN